MAYSIEDMLYLMARLRDPQAGCPWDLEQSSKDIINYSIEEVYELAESVEAGDPAAVRDELGDVLFQVVFLSRLGEEQSAFNFHDVVSSCVEKLVRRHPHVFPDGSLYGDSEKAGVDNVAGNAEIDSEQVKKNWEQIKQQERNARRQYGLFDDVPVGLPALNRAEKLQKRAGKIGLDWPDSSGPLAKIQEELVELQAVESQHPKAENRGRSLEEVGDLLFAIVNFCRKAGISPEQALRHASRKFVQRVEAVDQKLQKLPEAQKNQAVIADTLDRLWEQVKLERG